MAQSHMAREVHEIPQAVERLLKGSSCIRDLAARARALDPPLIATVARGSSDHACTFLKYAAELTLGIPVASIGPSVASVYKVQLRLGSAVCIAVSQSGQSPDIVALTEAARAGGALTVALTNSPGSPIAIAAGNVIPLNVGVEQSVAATKSFVASAVAGLTFLAHWKGDDDLLAAIHALPERLARAVEADWSPLAEALAGRDTLFCLGRGPSWAMANEAALKFKEVALIHAGSYSSAEVLHGPVAVVGGGFPVLVFSAADAAEGSVAAVADRIAETGAAVFVTSDRCRTAEELPHVRTDHPLCDPIALVTSFYAFVERLARERGLDPDRPRNLAKVTETL
jgi:glucosamine--fructose-6-phosphate aminotransferase (isomerizing)